MTKTAMALEGVLDIASVAKTRVLNVARLSTRATHKTRAAVLHVARQPTRATHKARAVLHMARLLTLATHKEIERSQRPMQQHLQVVIRRPSGVVSGLNPTTSP